jgi:tRNA threonylcarbamoyladenosine biosynthesis protein TsaB
MKILGIDTSTKAGSLALVEDSKIIWEYNFYLKTTHSEHLLPLIKEMLEQGGVKVEDLSGIAVVSGPGSFTGLRVGVSCARTLAQWLKIPLVGVSSLDALAWPFSFQKEAYICPLIDARKREVYTSLYENRKGFRRCEDYLAISPFLWADRLKEKVEKDGKKVILVGNGLSLYQGIFEEKLGRDAFFVPAVFSSPRAVVVVWLAQKEITNSPPVKLIKPFYLRPSEAELKWKQKEKDGQAKN